MDASDNEDYEISDDEWEKKLTEIAPGIGWLVITFNKLENRINEILVDALSGCSFEDEKAHIFISELSYGGKINSLIKYFRYLIRSKGPYADNILDELALLSNQLNEAGALRNKYVHANWSEIRRSSAVFIKYKIEKEGLKELEEIIFPEQIKLDEEKINSIHEKLDDYYLNFC